MTSKETRLRWQAQCDAARSIREHFGSRKALVYLVAEKFRTMLWALERDPELAPEVNAFAAEIRVIFPWGELRDYLDRARQRRNPGVPTDDLRYPPEEALRIAKMKLLLLGEKPASYAPR